MMMSVDGLFTCLSPLQARIAAFLQTELASHLQTGFALTVPEAVVDLWCLVRADRDEMIGWQAPHMF
jgi:hypothetical protein